MPASPRRDLDQRPAAGRAPQRAGDQRDPGRVLGRRPARRPGQRAEQRGDAAEVLGGEHLGRREQRRLAAGVDHLQHRPQRARPSCPSRPRPAAAGASGAPGQVGGDLGADLALPVGQLVRQPRVERGQQPVRGGAGGPCRAGSRRPSLRCTRVSCTANASSHLSRVRAAHSASWSAGRWISRSAVPRSTSLRPARRSAGSGSAGAVQGVQHEPYAAGDRPGRHRGRGRVDRDQRAGELLDLVGRRPPRRRAARYSGLLSCRLRPELGDLAGEQPAPADLQLALAPGLVEEGQGERAAGAVADDDLEQLAPALPHRPHVRRRAPGPAR